MSKLKIFKVRGRAYYNLLAWHGARIMDENNPGWHKEIDSGILDLADGSACILGQTHGWWRDGAKKLGLSRKEAEKFGFVLNLYDSDGNYVYPDDSYEDLNKKQAEAYSKLTEAWIREVKKRL